MSGYDNSNSGALFRNEKKTKPTQPDYTGSWEDGSGNEYFMSGWLKESKTGKKFMSLAATPKDGQPAPASRAPVEEDFEGDIPF